MLLGSLTRPEELTVLEAILNLVSCNFSSQLSRSSFYKGCYKIMIFKSAMIENSSGHVNPKHYPKSDCIRLRFHSCELKNLIILAEEK